MTFLSLTSLFWLMPVLGAIVVLYLMRMRRQNLRVPATFLWPQVTSDVRANAPFQRLRFTWLFMLQLLIATLLVFALTGPMRRVRGLAQSATVIVLDNSAAMSATDVAPTRLGEALRRIRNLIGAMQPGDRMALIDAGATTKIVFPLSSDKPAMETAIRSLEPGDATGNLGEALRIAAALVAGRTRARLLVLSDGCFNPVTDFSPGKAALLYEPIGSSYKNVAVTAFDSALSPSGALQCFASIRNFAPSPLPVTVSFKLDGQVANARQITIPAGQAVAETVNAPPGTLKAEVETTTPGDILPSDDRATIFLKGAGTVRTLLVSNGNLFLERALSLNPAVRLERAAEVPESERLDSPAKGSYDLVVFDNVPPVPVKAPAVWSFGCTGSQFGVTDRGYVAHPSVVDWLRDDPVTRYADFRGTEIDRARMVRPIAGANTRTLVTGSEGPLIVVSHSSGRKSIYAAFSVLDSDFPLRVSFPVFIANSIEWLTSNSQPVGGAGSGIMVHPGKSFSVSVSGGSANLISPDGSRVPLNASSGVAIVRGLDKVGIYRIDGPQAKAAIAVNMLDEEASDVRPRAILNLSGFQVAGTKSQGISLSEIWRPIVLVALGLMCLEWWVFVRRS